MTTSDEPRWETTTRSWTRRRFDVWNEVPLVPQLTGMSCWAAAAAMVVGWRDRVPVEPQEVAAGVGRWSAYQDGLVPEDLEHLARAWGLVVEPPIDWDVEQLRERLEQQGPLWMGEASPGLHSIVVTGVYGDGSPQRSFARVNDPWPVGRGERYVLSIDQLLRNFRAATDVVGVHAQVLHAGGRGHGSSRRFFSEHHASTTTSRRANQEDAMTTELYQSPRIGHRRARQAARAFSAIPAGERYLQTSSFTDDPLATHGGGGDNLFLRWNALDSAIDAIDVVVHFHGYTSSNASTDMLRRKVSISGLDLSSRSRPTLAILPRGRKITAAELERERAEAQRRAAETGKPVSMPNPSRYTFPGLQADSGGGLERLVGQALAWLAREVLGGSSTPMVDRLLLTAHSGGGAAVNGIVRNRATRRICNPQELHIFDAIYFGASAMQAGIEGWVRERIAADLAASTPSGGMRVLYGPSTRDNARWLAGQLAGADLIGGTASSLAARYRVEDGGSDHDGIPNQYGPALLGDVAAELFAAASGQAFGRAYGTPVGLFRHYSTRALDLSRDAPVRRPRTFGVRGAFALVDQNSSQAEQSNEVRRNIARTVGQAEAGGRFDLVHDDSNRVNFGIGSWTGPRIADVLDVYITVAGELGATARMFALFGGQASFEALRDRFRSQGTAATASTGERAALRSLGQDVDLQEAQVRQLADDVHADLDAIGREGNPWYPWIDGGMGAISEVAAHVLVHARHQAGAGGFRTVLRRAIDHFGGDDALGRAMVAGTVTERDFLTQVGEEVTSRVRADLQAGVRARYTNLINAQSGSVLSYYFDPA